MSSDPGISLPRTSTNDPPSKPAPQLEETVDWLIIQVDRLKQANKILRWVAVTAVTFALGSAITVGRMLYGIGADDQATRNSIERAQARADETRTELHELQRFIYRRFGVDTRTTTPTKEEP